ncbi:MAG: threonine--tRNA ligase, partial [Solobacterium sp.]|nr:threonine--tRNA ligase [Solobacterium sp.]
AALKKHKIRVKMDDRNEKLGYRVREAQTQKIPVSVVVGDGEEKENTVTVRRYGSKEETKMSLDDFVNAMLDEIERKGK